MNLTLQKFGYPESLIREFKHWVVLIRPEQLTIGSIVIAAKSTTTSFGGLDSDEIREWPSIVNSFEKTTGKLFGANKFNYLGLMMVDPNPHFHGIPRYSEPVSFGNMTFVDENYPSQIQLAQKLPLDNNKIKDIQSVLTQNWIE